MKKKFKKIKIIAIIFLGGILSTVSIGFVDNYFEISKNLDIFATLFREVNIYYVDKTNPGSLIEKSIEGMLGSLDPYTVYIPESEIEDHQFTITGQYGGIGALIRKKGDHIIIAEPYEGFPAHKAGLIAGDVLLEVDGVKIEGKNTGDVSKVLKGQKGSPVKLLMKREGEPKPFELNLIRDEIVINSVPYYGMLNDHIGYVMLNSFTDNAFEEVKKALLKMKENKELHGVILDMRGNPGGLLREAVNIVNLFVEKGHANSSNQI